MVPGHVRVWASRYGRVDKRFRGNGVRRYVAVSKECFSFVYNRAVYAPSVVISSNVPKFA